MQEKHHRVEQNERSEVFEERGTREEKKERKWEPPGLEKGGRSEDKTPPKEVEKKRVFHVFPDESKRTLCQGPAVGGKRVEATSTLMTTVFFFFLNLDLSRFGRPFPGDGRILRTPAAEDRPSPNALQRQ